MRTFDQKFDHYSFLFFLRFFGSLIANQYDFLNDRILK